MIQLYSFHVSTVMFKILQARLQQCMNWEFPDVHAGFQRSRGPEIKLPATIGSWRKQGNSRKTSISALWITLKPLFVWITTQHTVKLLKRWDFLTTLPVSWETCMWAKKRQLESDMEQWTDSKLEKEYDKAIYCHPVYSTYMQNTSCEMPGWMNHKL